MTRAGRLFTYLEGIREILLDLPLAYPETKRNALERQLEVSAVAILENLRRTYDITGGKAEEALKDYYKHHRRPMRRKQEATHGLCK